MAKQIIQRIKDDVSKIYDRIRNNASDKTSDTKFTIKKTTKVYVTAVIKNLREFQDVCVDQQLKKQVNGMCIDVGICRLMEQHNYVLYIML
ncbi:unnamed protein product [Didymodactylos carnosus]|uniref:Uncharacterized protein n=1 Tax=Didymodactylos carnosus TaxID=1234261 RepID=A0A814JCA9_9BILA|nr:unnamed protein product [Didymodactylos carnosus]CAF3806928.1 unnamed protein product [Didymodactylos carnosus]